MNGDQINKCREIVKKCEDFNNGFLNQTETEDLIDNVLRVMNDILPNDDKQEQEKDWNFRELLLFGREYSDENYPSRHDIVHFGNKPLRVIQQLVNNGFIGLDDQYNSAPRVRDMINFVATHPNTEWTFHGYCVSPHRNDSRITIEGIEAACCEDQETIIDFLVEFVGDYGADEWDVNKDTGHLYCWFD